MGPGVTVILFSAYSLSYSTRGVLSLGADDELRVGPGGHNNRLEDPPAFLQQLHPLAAAALLLG